MAAYVSFLAILVVWTFLALRRGAPLRAYAIIYGVNAVISLVTEGLFALVLHRYSFGGYAGFLLTTIGIGPLLTILYAHYAHRRPLLGAIAGALLLGGVLELMFLEIKAFRYDRGWSPYWTIACFTAYFLWTWWLNGSSVIQAQKTSRR
jgi:hypothetical protein